MSDQGLNLDQWRLFADLAADDVAVVLAACEERLLVAGEDLFLEADQGESLFIVQSGRVVIYKNIRGEVDRVLATLGPGDVIGELSFIDRSRRSAGSRTTEQSEFLVLSATEFGKLGRTHPRIAAGLYRNLASIVAARLRTTNERYREAVLSGLEASGPGSLSLKGLAEEMRQVTLHLLGDVTVTGCILQVDHHAAGYSIVVKDKAEKLSIIPYHAIQRMDLT